MFKGNNKNTRTTLLTFSSSPQVFCRLAGLKDFKKFTGKHLDRGITLEHLRMTASEILNSKTVAQMCSVKEVFLKLLQNSQENTCARVSF